MPKLLIYNTDTKQTETFTLAETDAMPYSYGSTLSVKEFRGVSKSDTLWTTVQAMESWNTTRRRYGKPIQVGYAFRRIWEGGHGVRSQHYSGLAFDVGQRQGQAARTAIRNIAQQTKAWGYVEPGNLTPTWVHFDRRYFPRSGYPTIRGGSKGVYVMLLQDALSTAGHVSGTSITGMFDPATDRALRAYQASAGLTVDGICGANTWRTLTAAVHKKGRTATTID